LATEALQLKDVRIGYGNVEVVYGVDISVGRGQLVYLMGRNGVGKTTTLKCIMGLIKPISGSIRHEGTEIAGKPSYELAKMGIGFVPDNRRIFPFLTVTQNLEIFAENPHGASGWTLKKVYELFPILKKRESIKAGTLSGGEQEMLAVARALMRNPRTLLLDEPFEGLAPLVIGNLAEIFSQVKGSVSILLVEQNEKHSIRIADRCYRMERGRIESEYSPVEVGHDTGDEPIIGKPSNRNTWEI